MLDILSWLIPQSTKEIMSSADWLLTVLAIYFHDLGMIVTNKEYDSRGLSGFSEYRDNVLFTGDDGKDYYAKIEQYYTDPDKAERFLYEEFVRHNHAKRIGMWIMSQAPTNLGFTQYTMLEVHKLVEPLKPLIRRDLALLCESHHLDDLNDFRKYHVSEPYRGNSKEETANLQYSAALLRSADLLNITSDRTPSITFRLINPTDPLSQVEWAKQAAVNSVRPKIVYGQDGKPDAKALNDTIEVHAYFLDQDGFFGLTSYLPYVAAELARTFAWVKEANLSCGALHQFPWRCIDDSRVDSKGFIRGEFGFEIDQKKILDLLTGHTLYNETDVVIRELVQNSLDAIRLQEVIDTKSGITSEPGKVQIHWDSKKRTLCVQDNGTGMTEETIRKHFLKVGDSLYQDEVFQKQYPAFSSISRFGIGVLSTFMIADAVEVTTCHPCDSMARKISLRSVHGKFLIRSLDKDSDELPSDLVPHGTHIKLTVRQSAKKFDVIRATQKWIAVPRCDISVTVNNNNNLQSVAVGFPSPKMAVEYALECMGILVDNVKIKVEEVERGGVTLAYALGWSDFFKEWTFLRPQVNIDSARDVFLGTSVEGIRVVFDTPGFESSSIIAIANATGPDAPKTNVARSGLEITGRDKLLQIVYSIYCEHIRKEMQKLHKERSFSLTWATREATYLLFPLLDDPSPNRKSKPLNSDLLTIAIRKLPAALVERQNRREAISFEELRHLPFFWTIECPLFDSAESILREVLSEASLSDVIAALRTNTFKIPEEPVLCGVESLGNVWRYVFEGKEVDQIMIDREQRRVDLRWVDRINPTRWRGLHEIWPSLRQDDLLIAKEDGVKISGLVDEIGVATSAGTYLLYGSSISMYLLSLLDQALKDPTDKIDSAALLFHAVARLLRGRVSHTEETLRRAVIDSKGRYSMGSQEIDEIIRLFMNTNIKIFSPYAWQRNVSNYYNDINY